MKVVSACFARRDLKIFVTATARYACRKWKFASHFASVHAPKIASTNNLSVAYISFTHSRPKGLTQLRWPPGRGRQTSRYVLMKYQIRQKSRRASLHDMMAFGQKILKLRAVIGEFGHWHSPAYRRDASMCTCRTSCNV